MARRILTPVSVNHVSLFNIIICLRIYLFFQFFFFFKLKELVDLFCLVRVLLMCMSTDLFTYIWIRLDNKWSSCLQDLYDIHVGFHSQLSKAAVGANGLRLSQVFLSWREKFLAYGDYCANLTKAQDRIQHVCDTNDFVNQEVMVSIRSFCFCYLVCTL